MADTALEKLFELLNIEDEDLENFYFDDELKKFPYVNGGLFAACTTRASKIFIKSSTHYF